MSNDKEKQQQAVIPNRENVTTAQMQNLLSVLSHTANFLIASQMHGPQDDDTGGTALDGGAKCAVETTIINVCSRLDAVLADGDRWNVTEHLKTEQALRSAYEQQGKMLEAQAAAYAEITTPHHRYKPQLVRMPDKTWLAFAGNPDDLDNALCGIGDSPKQALEAFDELFSGRVPEHLAGWLAAREAAETAGQKPPSVEEYTQSQQNKKTESNEKNTPTVDGTGNKQSEGPARARRFHKRYRPSPGTEPEVGGDSFSPQ
jgi:hypothetical protein